jgi:hypothetical protein
MNLITIQEEENPPETVYLPANTLVLNKDNSLEFYTEGEPQTAIMINWMENYRKCLVMIKHNRLVYVDKNKIYK